MCMKSSQFMNAYVGQEFKLSGFPGCSGFLSALESCRAESTSDWTGMEISGWTSELFLGKATLTILSTAPDAGPQNFWSPPVHSPQVIDITQSAAAETPVHRLSADLQSSCWPCANGIWAEPGNSCKGFQWGCCCCLAVLFWVVKQRASVKASEDPCAGILIRSSSCWARETKFSNRHRDFSVSTHLPLMWNTGFGVSEWKLKV